MRRFLFLCIFAVFCAMPVFAQSSLNGSADAILGEYSGTQGGDPFKVKISKNGNGSFKAQIFWVKNLKDASGKVRLDAKNPDKSLRNVPADKIVLFDALKYNSAKKQWDGAKIYDPQRGIRANAVGSFKDDKTLTIKGSLMGMSETVVWKRIESK